MEEGLFQRMIHKNAKNRKENNRNSTTATTTQITTTTITLRKTKRKSKVLMKIEIKQNKIRTYVLFLKYSHKRIKKNTVNMLILIINKTK